MNQRDAVIETMEKNGGYATLGILYQEVFKIKSVDWGTQTPLASIRRIVQDKKYFLRVKRGLYILHSRKDILSNLEAIDRDEKLQSQFNHSYYQGLLLEAGSWQSEVLQVFAPKQDRSKMFLNKRIGDISSHDTFYQFGYQSMVHKARNVDVVWFNDRKMPPFFF